MACNVDAVCHTRRIATYSVGYDSRSLDTSRLDGLEDIHHTFCLQTFQLRVDTQERPTPHNPITGRERENTLHYVAEMNGWLPAHDHCLFREGKPISVFVSLSISGMIAEE